MSPEQVRRHIDFKVSCRELDPLVAERMKQAQDADPSLEYHQLLTRALNRPLPDVAFHVAPPEEFLSILSEGLRAQRPDPGVWDAVVVTQPRGVYLSDLYEAMSGKYSRSLPCHVWKIQSLDQLAPEWSQDRLNPSCWVVHRDIPARLLTLHYTIR